MELEDNSLANFEILNFNQDFYNETVLSLSQHYNEYLGFIPQNQDKMKKI